MLIGITYMLISITYMLIGITYMLISITYMLISITYYDNIKNSPKDLMCLLRATRGK